MIEETAIRLVIGLGNPGTEYQLTRHNVGFMVADALASEWGVSFGKSRHNCLIGKGRINDRQLFLAKPTAYMNRSGHPIQSILQYYKIKHEEMLVIHDDIDLIYGKVKIKKKGGHGGHNGLRSIINVVGSDQFIRLRVGIGRSEDVTGHVLGKFTPDEKNILGHVIGTAKDAAITICCESVTVGMNQYNRRSSIVE